MKRLLTLSGCFLVLLSACNKGVSDLSMGSSIVADFDGKTETFNYNVVGVKINSTGLYSISLVGYNQKDTGSEHIAIVIGGPNPVAKGSFTFDPPDGQNSAVVVYVLANSTDGYGPADLGGTNPVTVNITSLTGTNIQGTFSGTLALDDGSSPVHKVVTNGKFNVNYK